MFSNVVATALASAGVSSSPELVLPRYTGAPLQIDFSVDPVLNLSNNHTSSDAFRQIVGDAVLRHPARSEAAAGEDEARAGLSESRERLLPAIDINVSSFRTIARDFSNDPQNILERSRPSRRTDVALSVQQTLLDFGAISRRIEAAGARLKAASAEVENATDRVALKAISAWFDLFAYQGLVALTTNSVSEQRTLRGAIEERVRQGVSAQADLARVDSYIASTQTRLARGERALANAEARFEEFTGTAAPRQLARAPVLAPKHASKDAAIHQARSIAAVRVAEATADAARQDHIAARRERLPNLSASVDAGRYGVFENERDYDVRGRVTLRQRFFGGIEPRVDQMAARARAAQARAERVREEAVREASIAWSDVSSLEAQLAATRASYIASRTTRDALMERFRVARGTLFDLITANDAYVEAATSYVQTLAELDASRFVLLSRTGQLLNALNIDVAPGEESRR